MKNRESGRKKAVIVCCGTPLALYRDRHGMLHGKSPWPKKRMHRKGGGRGEFENILERKNSSIIGWRPGK
jgi:hypothetical protein